MKIRSFLTALTGKITVLLIGAVIVGLAIYSSVTKTIPGLTCCGTHRKPHTRVKREKG